MLRTDWCCEKQPHDAFDLTDNDIQVLGNFPLSPRVRTLLLARNRIAAIQPSLPAAVPGLRNLVLASNQIVELADLDVLGRFAALTHLVLVDNPVTKKEVGFPGPDGWLGRLGGVLTGGGSIIGTGSSGGARRCGSWIIRKSRTRSGTRRGSCLARRRR